MPHFRFAVRLPLAITLALCLAAAAPAAFAAEEGAACFLPARTAVDAPFALNIAAQALPSKLDYGLLYYRNMMNNSWKTVFLKALADGKHYQALIPGQQITKPGIELYVVVYDKRGKESAICFSKNDPGLLLVDNGAAPVVAAPPAPNPLPSAAETIAESAPSSAEAAPLSVAPSPGQGADKPQDDSFLAPKTLSQGQTAPVAINNDTLPKRGVRPLHPRNRGQGAFRLEGGNRHLALPEYDHRHHRRRAQKLRLRLPGGRAAHRAGHGLYRNLPHR